MVNLEWVYYEDLLKEYSENYLFDLLRTGNLQPYDINGNQIHCPHDHHEYYHVHKILSNIRDREKKTILRTCLKQIMDSEFPNGYTDPNMDKLSWTFLWLHKDEASKEALLLILKDSKFKKSEFNNIIRLSAGRSEQFSTLPGTEWRNITISFVALEKVKVNFEGNTYERGFKSLGFGDKKRQNSWNSAWHHLFLLAVHQGDIELPPSGKERDNVVKQVSNIKKQLKNLFPNVVGDPFTRRQKGKGWPLRITLSSLNDLHSLDK